MNDDFARQEISDRLLAKLDALEFEFRQLKDLEKQQCDRLDAVEKDNTDQWKCLKVQRTIQAGCIVALSIALTLKIVNLSPENQATMERVLVGIVAASSAGFVGAPLLSVPSRES